jgi:hypothetical protein
MGLIAGTFAVLFAAMGPRSEPRITVLVYNSGACRNVGARAESRKRYSVASRSVAGLAYCPRRRRRPSPRKSPYTSYRPARHNSITMPKASCAPPP